MRPSARRGTALGGGRWRKMTHRRRSALCTGWDELAASLWARGKKGPFAFGFTTACLCICAPCKILMPMEESHVFLSVFARVALKIAKFFSLAGAICAARRPLRALPQTPVGALPQTPGLQVVSGCPPFSLRSAYRIIRQAQLTAHSSRGGTGGAGYLPTS